MNNRQIALLTRRLIEKCGGLEEASRACASVARPYSIQQLSRCQTADSGCFLPIDILAALESYCGEPVFSRALVEAVSNDTGPRRFMDEVLDVAEAAVELQRETRAALSDGSLTERERRALQSRIEEVRGELAGAEAALNAAEPAANAA